MTAASYDDDRWYRAPCSTPPHSQPARRASAAMSSSSFNNSSKYLESRSKA
jgi:hypothetical protein